MKVILTEKVKTLGNVGEIVNVSQGYGRNFLIPGNLAVLADDGNTKQMEDHQKRLAKKVDAERNAAKELLSSINGLSLTFTKKVGGTGKLFGTITTNDISKELDKLGHSIERRVLLIENPIKALGTFEVKAKLFDGVEGAFNVTVEMDPKQAEEIKKKQAAAAKKKAAQKDAPEEVAAEGEAVDGETTADSEETTEA